MWEGRATGPATLPSLQLGSRQEDRTCSLESLLFGSGHLAGPLSDTPGLEISPCFCPEMSASVCQTRVFSLPACLAFCCQHWNIPVFRAGPWGWRGSQQETGPWEGLRTVPWPPSHVILTPTQECQGSACSWAWAPNPVTGWGGAPGSSLGFTLSSPGSGLPVLPLVVPSRLIQWPVWGFDMG